MLKGPNSLSRRLLLASLICLPLYLAATDNKLMTGVMQTQGFTPTVSAYPEETTACASDRCSYRT